MELESFFDKKHIIFLENTEKPLVLRELLNKLEEFGEIDNSSRYYTQIIHRESLENTGIGKGVAIPHTRTETVPEFVSILGISRGGIDYQSFDGVPVNYVLLNIFPTKLSTQYLYLIGMISRIFTDKARVKELNAAGKTSEIYSILKSEFKNYFDNISNISEKADISSENLSGVPSSDLDLLIQLDRLYQLFDEGDTTDSIVRKIERLKTLIDNRSLTYYERMRKKCQSPFSILEKCSCSGCHMEIPSVHLKEIREGKGISVCNYCGRFLILV
ncbi:MAG: PTS sugar transporter subunit IIA [Spirochaetes bacterium]|nr:PTS sugar transporter subunit IIA [Spirochaetota bacterium]